MGVYLALGANQPTTIDEAVLAPAQTFKTAIEVLKEQGIQTLQASHAWQSPAWPDPKAQPPYVNAVIEVSTNLHPIELLEVLKNIETRFGRRDDVRNAPRPLDLDIIDLDGAVLESPRLTLPHPRMLDRAFVLLPLSEIAPHWRDPKQNRPIRKWIARLQFNDVWPLKRLGSFI